MARFRIDRGRLARGVYTIDHQRDKGRGIGLRNLDVGGGDSHPVGPVQRAKICNPPVRGAKAAVPDVLPTAPLEICWVFEATVH